MLLHFEEIIEKQSFSLNIPRLSFTFSTNFPLILPEKNEKCFRKFVTGVFFYIPHQYFSASGTAMTVPRLFSILAGLIISFSTLTVSLIFIIVVTDVGPVGKFSLLWAIQHTPYPISYNRFCESSQLILVVHNHICDISSNMSVRLFLR